MRRKRLGFKPVCHCKQLNQSALSSFKKSQRFGVIFGIKKEAARNGRARRKYLFTMGSNEMQSTEQRSSNKTTEVLPMEPERRKREGGDDASTYSQNTISVSDKTTEPRHLKLRIQNNTLVIVQQSLAKQLQFNLECTLHKREKKPWQRG